MRSSVLVDIFMPLHLWLTMTNVAGVGGTNVTFALTNSNAGAYSVQFSTNLQDWDSIGAATPRFFFTDPKGSSGPQRYYRLVFP